MKPHEVWIIVAVVLVLGYLWYKSAPSPIANPTNASSAGFVNQGPMPG